VEFCRNPRPAVDRLAGTSDLVLSTPPRGKESIRQNWGLVHEYLALGGPRELIKRVMGRVLKVIRLKKQRLKKPSVNIPGAGKLSLKNSNSGKKSAAGRNHG